MKKTIIIVIAIFIIIIIFGIIVQNYLESSSARLSKELETIELLALTDNMELANEINILLKEKWEKTKGKWSIFIDHYEIDNIEECMIKMNSFLEDRKITPELLGELKTLKFYVDHIPKREDFNLQNIL
jgi:hypothetical protein